MQDRPAAEIFHRDVVVVAGAADVVDADDVAMVQLRGDFRFAQEALAEIRIGEQRRRHDLQRDFAIDRFLHREIDGRHAAAAELAQQTVAGDLDHVTVISMRGTSQRHARLRHAPRPVHRACESRANAVASASVIRAPPGIRPQREQGMQRLR